MAGARDMACDEPELRIGRSHGCVPVLLGCGLDVVVAREEDMNEPRIDAAAIQSLQVRKTVG